MLAVAREGEIIPARDARDACTAFSNSSRKSPARAISRVFCNPTQLGELGAGMPLEEPPPKRRVRSRSSIVFAQATSIVDLEGLLIRHPFLRLFANRTLPRGLDDYLFCSIRDDLVAFTFFTLITSTIP